MARVVFIMTLAVLATTTWADEPFFIEQPENVTTVAGEKVVLKCRIGNGRNRKAQWTRNGFGLGTERSLTEWPHLRMTGRNEQTDWDLEIYPVGIKDDGNFQCQMTPLRSRNAIVTVQVPPDDPFIENGPVIHVKESVDVQLKCIARNGKPPPKMNWYDPDRNMVNNSTYKTSRMSDSKLFESSLVMTFTPQRFHHNQTFSCETWNEAGSNMRPALARIFVQYAPSVTVTPVRPGMVQEGDKATFRCNAEANPPPFEDSYKWFIDNNQVRGQHGFYFEIFNVTRDYHDKQVQCSVQNDLGKAMGLKSIEVKYGPTFRQHPRTTSGDRLQTVTLYCIVDSNPPPLYFWTKGSSREVVSHEQNMTAVVNESNVGTFYCHAETPGYSRITSRPAEVLMTGEPKISSSEYQTGVAGQNVHINCAATSIPEAQHIYWSYHNAILDDSNPHYSIINSPIQHGVRSTLIIRQALSTDFGQYTCAIENHHGVSEIHIQLDEQRPFPFHVTLISIFGGVIFVLLIIIAVILLRKKMCCYSANKDKDNDKKSNSTDSSGLANNVLVMKVNNQMSNACSLSHVAKADLPTPSLSNEADSAWEGSDNQDSNGFYRTNTFRTNSDIEPEFPPKPDVISTGYVPYGQYVRDYDPPALLPGQESPIYASHRSAHLNSQLSLHLGNNTLPSSTCSKSSMLNVSDPRFSATYGNPYLRQTGPRNMQCSTFLPPPHHKLPLQSPSSAIGPVTSTISSLGSGDRSSISVPMSTRSFNTPPTPNASLNCLPEEVGMANFVVSRNVCQSETPTPPPPATPIYARIAKKDPPPVSSKSFVSPISSMAQGTLPRDNNIVTGVPTHMQVISTSNGCVQGPLKAVGSLQRPQDVHQHLNNALKNSVGTHV